MPLIYDDFDLLSIKVGWLVDKSNSNRPLPFVNQEKGGGGGKVKPALPPTYDYKGQNTP